jgi:hypothetical protein
MSQPRVKSPHLLLIYFCFRKKSAMALQAKRNPIMFKPKPKSKEGNRRDDNDRWIHGKDTQGQPDQ